MGMQIGSAPGMGVIAQVVNKSFQLPAFYFKRILDAQCAGRRITRVGQRRQPLVRQLLIEFFKIVFISVDDFVVLHQQRKDAMAQKRYSVFIRL